MFDDNDNNDINDEIDDENDQDFNEPQFTDNNEEEQNSQQQNNEEKTEENNQQQQNNAKDVADKIIDNYKKNNARKSKLEGKEKTRQERQEKEQRKAEQNSQPGHGRKWQEEQAKRARDERINNQSQFAYRNKVKQAEEARKAASAGAKAGTSAGTSAGATGAGTAGAGAAGAGAAGAGAAGAGATGASAAGAGVGAGAGAAGAGASAGAGAAGAVAGIGFGSVFFILIIVVLIIIFIVGIYGFFTSMPAMIIGMLKKAAADFWSNVSYGSTGYYANINEDEVKNLAQYLENNGYIVSGYGFAKPTYSEDSAETQEGHSKTIDKVEGDKYQPNVLYSYLVADQQTFVLAQESTSGNLQAIINGGTSESYSSGLIDIPDYEVRNRTLIDPDKQRMTIYEKGFNLKEAILKTLTSLGGMNNTISSKEFVSAYGKDSIKWGQAMGFDLSDWTSKYGRPVELFLALHISTCMPDLTYEIAMDQAFNTKVNISAQRVKLTYQDATITKDGTQYSMNDIYGSYIDYIIGSLENIVNEQDSSEASISNANDAMKKLKSLSSSDKANFVKRFSNAKGNKASVAEILKEMYPEYEYNSDDNLTIYKPSGHQSSSLSGIRTNQLQALTDLLASEETVYFPYISSVTNHWFYQRINFRVGEGATYKAAKNVTQRVVYDPEEKGEELSGLSIVLDGKFEDQSGTGILYQINEPYVHGPNSSIIDLFTKNKFYRYDGTLETARKIYAKKMADDGKTAGKKYTFNGEEYILTDEEINDDTIFKQSPTFGTVKDTLSAFDILRQVHTEASDYIYRMLKELAVSDELKNGGVGTLTREALTEPLKQVFVWPFSNYKNGIKTKNANDWTVKKDTNKYGIVISDVADEAFLAPGDGKITKVEGDTITIEFDPLSEADNDNPETTVIENPSTKRILEEKYKKDFYVVDVNISTGMTMVVKGVKDATVGPIKRLDKIATAKKEVKIYMQHSNKTLVGTDKNITTDDDVESYMNPTYTEYTERRIKFQLETIGTAFENAGVDSGSSGSSSGGSTSANSSLETFDTGVKVNEVGGDINVIYGIVSGESFITKFGLEGTGYDAALAVMSATINIMKLPECNGQSLYDVMASSRFEIYTNGQYKRYLNSNGEFDLTEILSELNIHDQNKIDDLENQVKQAVADAMNGKANHPFAGFVSEKFWNKHNLKEQIMKENNVTAEEAEKNYYKVICTGYYFNWDSIPEFSRNFFGG